MTLQRRLLCWLLFLSGALAAQYLNQAAGQGIKLPPKKLEALIVAVDHYTHLKQLQFPVKSGLELAKELHRVKYAITFLTDATSLETVKTALGDKATIEAVTDGAALHDRIVRWMDRNAATSQLALLVLSGHGVERDEKTWFLAAADKFEGGGVAIKDVNDRAAEKKLPLVVIFDACRKKDDTKGKADPARKPSNPTPPSSDPIDQAQGTAVSVSRGPLEKSDFLHPTNLFSTTAGKPAEDVKSDLIANLAKGLRTRAPGGFAAHSTGMMTTTDNESTLSLHAWFYFAVTEVLVSTGLRQSHELRIGRPDLSEVVAQMERKGVSKLPSFSPQRAIDLMACWFPEHGQYDAQTLLRGHGWQLAHPGKVILQMFKSGYLVAAPAAGFSTTGKALFVEFVVELPDAPNRALPITFGIDGKQAAPGRGDVFVLARGEKFQCSALTNKVTLVKIPLLPRQSLNYVGFSDLPAAPRCHLNVRRLYLADASLDVRAAAAAPVALLPRWWIGDSSPKAGEALPFGLQKGKTGPILKIGKASPRGWRGGPLAPPTWVRKGDRLDLEMETSAAMKVRIHLKEDYRSLLAESKSTLSLPRGKCKVSLNIAADGLANYFVVADPTADLDLHKVSIKPRW